MYEHICERSFSVFRLLLKCSERCTFTNGFIFNIKAAQVIYEMVEINVNMDLKVFGRLGCIKSAFRLHSVFKEYGISIQLFLLRLSKVICER